MFAQRDWWTNDITNNRPAAASVSQLGRVNKHILVTSWLVGIKWNLRSPEASSRS